MTQQEKINLIAVLEDVQEQLLIELEPELRHGMKRWMGKCRGAMKQFIRECDRVLKLENQEGFGESADIIRENLEDWMHGHTTGDAKAFK